MSDDVFVGGITGGALAGRGTPAPAVQHQARVFISFRCQRPRSVQAFGHEDHDAQDTAAPRGVGLRPELHRWMGLPLSASRRSG